MCRIIATFRFGSTRCKPNVWLTASHMCLQPSVGKHLIMKEKIEYGFWFWSHKLTGVLAMLAELAKYELDEIEIETIKHGLIGTNDELNQWTNYRFNGQKFNMEIEFAYDSKENAFLK